MPETAGTIVVEVVLARARRHLLRTLSLPAGSTAGDAVAAARFPAGEMVGVDGLAIHGERVAGATPLRDGDRVELLRPLQVDPKEARRLRAARQRR